MERIIVTAHVGTGKSAKSQNVLSLTMHNRFAPKITDIGINEKKGNLKQKNGTTLAIHEENLSCSRRGFSSFHAEFAFASK